MRSFPVKNLLLFVVLLAVVGGIFLVHFINSEVARPQKPPPDLSKSEYKYRYSPPVISHSGNETESEPRVDLAGRPKIPREKVEAWLAKHHRNAASLLAAFRALKDTNYLNEAAANYPNDPRVELAVLARDAFPADRRKWLDSFKASSPSNSLANYLSAQDYFKNGNMNAAVQELLAATSMTRFDTYSTETMLNSENLYSSSDISPGETATFAVADMAWEDLPELATFKRLAQGIRAAQQQYLNSGDSGSAAHLVQIGMQFGNRIEGGDSGKYLINQLVGIAIESMMLQQLNP